MTGLALALIVVTSLAAVWWLAAAADRGADRRLGHVSDRDLRRVAEMRDQEETS